MKHEWTENELAELEDPDQWDWDSGVVVHPEPGQPHHIRLVVELDGDDLALLEPAAKRAGVNIIDYVRDAALSRARRHPSEAELAS